jgi:hypothetical protein
LPKKLTMFLTAGNDTLRVLLLGTSSDKGMMSTQQVIAKPLPGPGGTFSPPVQFFRERREAT